MSTVPIYGCVWQCLAKGAWERDHNNVVIKEYDHAAMCTDLLDARLVGR